MRPYRPFLIASIVAAAAIVPALSGQSDVARSLANKIEHRAALDISGSIERPLRRPENDSTSQPLRRDSLADPAPQSDSKWSRAIGVIVQSGYSSNPENASVARGAWLARQAFEIGFRRAVEGGAFSFGAELDSVVYERPARANNEIDPGLAAGFRREVEGKTVQVGVSHGSAIIENDTIVVVSGTNLAIGLPLSPDSGWSVSFGGALEKWDYRLTALDGLTATRATGSVVLNRKLENGAVVHCGVARVNNAARAAAADATTNRLLISMEPWTLPQSKWQIAWGLRFDRRTGRHVTGGLRRRDDIEVFSFDLTRPLGATELVVNVAHKRQRSNAPDSAFRERLGRIGLRRSF